MIRLLTDDTIRYGLLLLHLGLNKLLCGCCEGYCGLCSSMWIKVYPSWLRMCMRLIQYSAHWLVHINCASTSHSFGWNTIV